MDDVRHDLKVSDVPGLPGCWVDAAGCHHFDVRTINEAFGFENTPEGIAESTAILRYLLEKNLGKDLEVIVRGDDYLLRAKHEAERN
jgi:hypothetical protein